MKFLLLLNFQKYKFAKKSSYNKILENINKYVLIILINIQFLETRHLQIILFYIM